MSSRDNTDDQRFETLKRAVCDVGPIRRGSVVRRFVPCGKPGCRCQAKPPQLHGPYYQWTRYLRGKTVTVRLTEEEAEHIREWIENGRKLNRIVAEMEKLSLRMTDRLLRQLKAA
jgi:hypothetical protein